MFCFEIFASEGREGRECQFQNKAHRTFLFIRNSLSSVTHLKYFHKVLVIGDHGMSDAGSHGGSSISEVMTPIVALSPAFAANDLAGKKKKLQLVNQQERFNIFVPSLG